MIGLYLPRETFIHKLRPGVKLLSLAVCGTISFMVSSVPLLLVFLSWVALLYWIARIPLDKVIKQFKPLVPFLVFIFVFQAVFDGWLIGCKIILHFIILVSLASLVSLTTKVSDIVGSIEVGLQPFRFLGVNPSKLSMVSSMMIRFIPVINGKFNEVREAQRARGCDAHITHLAVSLIIRTVRIGSEVAEALDARSYNPDIDNEILSHDRDTVLEEKVQ